MHSTPISIIGEFKLVHLNYRDGEERTAVLFTAFHLLGIFYLFMSSCRFLNIEASHLLCDIFPVVNLIKLPLKSVFTLLHQGDCSRAPELAVPLCWLPGISGGIGSLYRERFSQLVFLWNSVYLLSLKASGDHIFPLA